ncbi:hypothetical protein HEQ62_09410, partial [Haematospirillum jordaniae]|nr:hypothetical protein [Haematospirillum jordaniae]NKD57895.1 hypothetical protein [Haematospirillum jordaniae]NKD59993.1 hypothetical protein [Haematospirillum jordaniae]NKD67931.1 hypothetical protein [Haematospirillum jordaniae]NKD80024.1 hypothetical protein [Haematospirillum jordaniae]
LAQAGLGGVHRLEQTANANHVMAELGEGIAALGHAMADGHIDLASSVSGHNRRQQVEKVILAAQQTTRRPL